MQWFYETEGKQNGPVSEDTLKEMFDRSIISGENLVWRDGMSDWAAYASVFASSATSSQVVDCPTCGVSVHSEQLIPAGAKQVCPNCRDEYAQGLREGLSTPVRSKNSRGTGGNTPNSTLRQMAREALSGSWGGAVLVVFLFTIIQNIGGAVPLVGPIIQWVVVGPLTLGTILYFIALNRDEGPEVGMMFNGFSRFGQGLGIYLVTNILAILAATAAALPGIVLIIMAYSRGAYSMPEEDPLFLIGVLVAAVPGAIVMIYMYLRYSMAYFIANDHPDAGVMMPVRRSVEMMDGRKGKLCILYISFIPWHFLGLLALLVGILWSMTYMWAGIAAFYDDLAEED